MNRANALSNGFNNYTLAAKGLEQDIKHYERHFGSALVPQGYNNNKLRAHAMNFINRRPAVRDHPATGPIYPSVITLNLLLRRKLYNTDEIDFVSTVARDKTFRAACVGDDCAELELLEAFSQRVELETTSFITTADVVEAITPGFSFDSPFVLCTAKEFIECKRDFGNVEGYRKPLPASEDYLQLVGDHMLSLFR